MNGMVNDKGEEFERIIRLTDTISLVVKVSREIDLATISAESALLSKISKAVESVNVAGLSVPVKSNGQGTRKSAKEIQDFFNTYEAAEDKHELARQLGVTVNALKAKYFYYKRKGSQPEMPISNSKVFSDADVRSIIRMKQAGLEPHEIAEKVGKTRRQVNDKIKYLKNTGAI